MANNYSFSVMPSVSISRSRFERKSQHKTSFNLGDIVPIYVDEVLPGDTRSIDLAALVRMSTPIAPIMDNIHLDLFAFYCPNRLVWDHWKEFMGENSASYGIPVGSYSVPAIDSDEKTSPDIATNETNYLKGLANYFGIPKGCIYREDDSGKVQISALPFRMYYRIYNDWFRNQNIIAPVPVYTGDDDGCVVSNTIGTKVFGTDMVAPLMKASKLPDYFTKALPYAQKGDAVTIPMSLTAPVVGAFDGNGDPVHHSLGTNSYQFGFTSQPDYNVLLGLDPGSNVSALDPDQVPIKLGTINSSNLVADLSKVAGTIDQLRYAFQLQKFLWRDAAYGSRYWEILAGHFNIKASDASLQRPEFLGGHRIEINVDQVLSTAGYSNTSSTTVGAPGANSVTGQKLSLFTKSFTEHGFIFILAVARHDQTYTQGINRMWMRKSKFDYYWPEFAMLGSQEVKLDEIYYAYNADRSTLFGYQEAWSEYRYKPSIATGLLNPGVTGALDYWTLANDYGSAPSLNQTFIEQGRTALARALVTGSTGPDFIGDFFFRDIAVRPMPTYSIPGLADHH